MIRLTKGAKPEILCEKEAEWTEEYQEYLRERAKLPEDDWTIPKAAATRYRHSDVKAAVIQESHSKCIYCESKVPHVAPGDIEHIRPKSLVPDEIVNWDNLCFACAECNRRKLTHLEPPLLNPFTEDPEQHLLVLGPVIFARADHERTQITLQLLGIDSRGALLAQRIQRLQSLYDKMQRWRKASTPALRDILREELEAEGNAEAEYAAVARSFLRSNADFAKEAHFSW